MDFFLRGRRRRRRRRRRRSELSPMGTHVDSCYVSIHVYSYLIMWTAVYIKEN